MPLLNFEAWQNLIDSFTACVFVITKRNFEVLLRLFVRFVRCVITEHRNSFKIF